MGCLADSQWEERIQGIQEGKFRAGGRRNLAAVKPDGGRAAGLQTFCTTLDGHTATPATARYDPGRDGQLFVCDTQHAHVSLQDGYATQLDAEQAASATQQHDCPPGSACRHDLEEGFMMDVWLLAPQAGQTIADVSCSLLPECAAPGHAACRRVQPQRICWAAHLCGAG